MPPRADDCRAASGQSDDGATLTLWTRAATESVSKAYADAYNATHRNKVQVTAYPNEEYPAKLASAAGARALPDLFAADVVFAAQYASQGLWADVTDRFGALPVKDKVAPSHVRAGTWEGRNYAVPHTIDLSVMLYNKDLYTQGRSRPREAAAHAEGVRRARPQDRPARRRGQRHVLRRQLRRVRRVHALAVGVGGGR